MLGEILKKSVCAQCRFCCAFRRVSLWEVPYISEEVYQKQPDKDRFEKIRASDCDCYRIILENDYKTEDPEEEAPCVFLDPRKGCTLSDEDKPLDCKIWPIRIMKKDGGYVLALSPTCPAVNKVPRERVRKVAESIENTVRAYAKEHPYIIKKYIDGYPVLTEFDRL
ncbi:MAG: hypothetical protein K5756_08015 [Clostridiales bacterium]|nr:hypothetical protein [Clostridiales bacterium]